MFSVSISTWLESIPHDRVIWAITCANQLIHKICWTIRKEKGLWELKYIKPMWHLLHHPEEQLTTLIKCQHLLTHTLEQSWLMNYYKITQQIYNWNSVYYLRTKDKTSTSLGKHMFEHHYHQALLVWFHGSALKHKNSEY